MFKVNNKDTRTYFTPCSSVPIVNFEHVNAGWVLPLTHFSQVFYCYTLKGSKTISGFTRSFLTFSRGIEMENWLKTA